MSESTTSRGRAQDPLNFLQRRIARSKQFDKTTKRHVILQIRKAKATIKTPEQGVSEACRLWSYSQMIRLEVLLDSLQVTDKGFKTAFWSRCKASEDYRRYLSRSALASNAKNGATGRVPTPMRQPVNAQNVPPADDGETA